jgi:hypothetical protein
MTSQSWWKISSYVVNVVLLVALGWQLGRGCGGDEARRQIRILTDSLLSYQQASQENLSELAKEIAKLEGRRPEVIVRTIVITDTVHGGGEGETYNDTFHFRDDSIVEYWVDKRTDSTWYTVFPIPLLFVHAWNMEDGWLLTQVYNQRDSSFLAADTVELWYLERGSKWWFESGLGVSVDREKRVSPVLSAGIGKGGWGVSLVGRSDDIGVMITHNFGGK